MGERERCAIKGPEPPRLSKYSDHEELPVCRVGGVVRLEYAGEFLKVRRHNFNIDREVCLLWPRIYLTDIDAPSNEVFATWPLSSSIPSTLFTDVKVHVLAFVE